MAKELLNVCEFSSFICYSFVSPFYLRVGLHRSTLDRAFSQHTNETERICRHQPTLSTNHLDIKYFVCCVEYKSIA